MKKQLFFFILLAYNVITMAQNFEPFTWQHPIYGGHTLNNVKWITGQKFIAVGDGGSILQSLDDGITWQITAPFTYVNFKGIFIKDSLTYFIVGSINTGKGEIYKTTDAGNSWSLIYNNLSMPLINIHFANDTVGYCVGDSSKIVKTTNGGLTWTDLSNPSNISGTFNTVWFLNADTGFVGRSQYITLFKTINGGLTWTADSGYIAQDCKVIKFLNDTIGYSVNNSYRICKTINGGTSWTCNTVSIYTEQFRGMDFANLTNGIAVTDGKIFRTTNGTTWNAFALPDNAFTSAAFSPNGSIVIVDTYGGLHTASNFSTAYTNRNPNTGYQHYFKIKFADAQNGWILGSDNNLLKTDDSGNSWSTVINPNTSFTYDFAVLSPNKAITLGYNGTNSNVYQTTDGGATFTFQTLSNNGYLGSISFPSATHGYVVGTMGTAFKTTDGGLTYSAMNTGVPANSTSNKVFFIDNNVGFIGGTYGLRKTTNGGISWNTISIPGLNNVREMYFTDLQNGYVANYYNGYIYRTSDGGATFNLAGQTCIYYPSDMQFLNDSTGFIVGGNNDYTCDFAYTTDYGATWNPVYFPYAYNFIGIHAFDPSNIFLIGQYRAIIRTSISGLVTQNVNQNLQSEERFAIFPNPSDGNFIIKNSEFKKMDNFTIQVYNTSGTLLIQNSVNTITTSLDLKNYPNGLYLVSITNNEGNYVYKISKN